MEIVETDQPTWDDFVERSPQGTIYVKSCFLKSFGKPVRYLFCKDREEIQAGIALTVSEDGESLRNPFQAYNGVLFRDLSPQKLYKQNEIRFSVLETFATTLFSQYRRLEIDHDPTVIDMRPFDWVNYHEREKGFYQVGVHYTRRVDLRTEALTSPEFSAEKGLVTRETADVSALDRLQGFRTGHEGQALRAICENLIAAKAGRLFVTYQGEAPVSGCFLGFDRKRAYILFETGTQALAEAIQVLREEGALNEVDLVGVLSPRHGDFKQSYGGELVPYFSVTKETAKDQ
ncbi:MAG: hypothetical protein ACXWPM_04235 [Bdellovibrionota bacterium]